MNYEQANAVKELALPVCKVLEGLEVQCPACNGTKIGVKSIFVEGGERHKWIDGGCPKCTEGKIPYTWTPQVGEWCIHSHPGVKEEVCLIVGVKEKEVKLSTDEYRPISLITPILEWEEIERILRKAGFYCGIAEFHDPFEYAFTIDKKDGATQKYSKISRQKTVMESVVEFGEELKKC